MKLFSILSTFSALTVAGLPAGPTPNKFTLVEFPETYPISDSLRAPDWSDSIGEASDEQLELRKAMMIILHDRKTTRTEAYERYVKKITDFHAAGVASILPTDDRNQKLATIDRDQSFNLANLNFRLKTLDLPEEKIRWLLVFGHGGKNMAIADQNLVDGLRSAEMAKRNSIQAAEEHFLHHIHHKAEPYIP